MNWDFYREWTQMKVAQSCTVFCEGRDLWNLPKMSNGLPSATRRHSRVKLCATNSKVTGLHSTKEPNAICKSQVYIARFSCSTHENTTHENKTAIH